MAALQEMLATQPLLQTFSRDSKSPPASVSFGLPESSQPVHLQSGRHGVGVTVVTVVAVGIVVGRVVVCGVVVEMGVGVVVGWVVVGGVVVGGVVVSGVVVGGVVVCELVVGVVVGVVVSVVVGVAVGVSVEWVVDDGPGALVVVVDGVETQLRGTKQQ